MNLCTVLGAGLGVSGLVFPRPGAVGTGTRVSPISCLVASSAQTTGRSGSYGRWYTSNTSSI
jgi:hypothetical protein